MRLLVHNLLACHAKNCAAPANFPLRFQEVERLEMQEAEFNEEFMLGFLPKLDWRALVQAARELGDDSLPEAQPDLPAAAGDLSEAQLEALKAIHHVLLEMHVQDGDMVCPQCAHVYRIKDGIPNMLLAEHEV